MLPKPIIDVTKMESLLVQIDDYNGESCNRREEIRWQDVEASRNVFPIVVIPPLLKMQGLDYKIENDHLFVACNGQSSWHYIGSMKGVVHARIVENGGGAAPIAPGNSIMLEINFPERGMTAFHIPYTNTAEAAKALNKSEQLIKDLIDFSRRKESAKEASQHKMEKIVEDLLTKQSQLYTLIEKQAIAPKCPSGNHD